jgi:hypothetical protein
MELKAEVRNVLIKWNPYNTCIESRPTLHRGRMMRSKTSQTQSQIEANAAKQMSISAPSCQVHVVLRRTQFFVCVGIGRPSCSQSEIRLDHPKSSTLSRYRLHHQEPRSVLVLHTGVSLAPHEDDKSPDRGGRSFSRFDRSESRLLITISIPTATTSTITTSVQDP